MAESASRLLEKEDITFTPAWELSVIFRLLKNKEYCYTLKQRRQKTKLVIRENLSWNISSASLVIFKSNEPKQIWRLTKSIYLFSEIQNVQEP